MAILYLLSIPSIVLLTVVFDIKLIVSIFVCFVFFVVAEYFVLRYGWLKIHK